MNFMSTIFLSFAGKQKKRVFETKSEHTFLCVYYEDETVEHKKRRYLKHVYQDNKRSGHESPLKRSKISSLKRFKCKIFAYKK